VAPGQTVNKRPETDSLNQAGDADSFTGQGNWGGERLHHLGNFGEEMWKKFFPVYHKGWGKRAIRQNVSSSGKFLREFLLERNNYRVIIAR
jgi:hypothetical protein